MGIQNDSRINYFSFLLRWELCFLHQLWCHSMGLHFFTGIIHWKPGTCMDSLLPGPCGIVFSGGLLVALSGAQKLSWFAQQPISFIQSLLTRIFIVIDTFLNCFKYIWLKVSSLLVLKMFWSRHLVNFAYSLAFGSLKLFWILLTFRTLKFLKEFLLLFCCNFLYICFFKIFSI